MLIYCISLKYPDNKYRKFTKYNSRYLYLKYFLIKRNNVIKKFFLKKREKFYARINSRLVGIFK